MLTPVSPEQLQETLDGARRAAGVLRFGGWNGHAATVEQLAAIVEQQQQTINLPVSTHDLLSPESGGICNYLTLVCLGHYAGWAASFDFNLVEGWYEADVIGKYRFAARADTPAAAIEAADALVRAALAEQGA
jgi:hypothetical protein